MHWLVKSSWWRPKKLVVEEVMGTKRYVKTSFNPGSNQSGNSNTSYSLGWVVRLFARDQKHLLSKMPFKPKGMLGQISTLDQLDQLRI